MQLAMFPVWVTGQTQKAVSLLIDVQWLLHISNCCCTLSIDKCQKSAWGAINFCFPRRPTLIISKILYDGISKRLGKPDLFTVVNQEFELVRIWHKAVFNQHWRRPCSPCHIKVGPAHSLVYAPYLDGIVQELLRKRFCQRFLVQGIERSGITG